jgi:hypothetical protein
MGSQIELSGTALHHGGEQAGQRRPHRRQHRVLVLSQGRVAVLVRPGLQGLSETQQVG